MTQDIAITASRQIPSSARKPPTWSACILNPPEKAIVVCVDEKPHIQALQRAQGYLRLPDGRAVNGFSHCYRRNGTTILSAALDVATGQVKTAHYTRRRRREFLDFMNEIVAANLNREIHVILDNLNTHKPKRDRWLKAHPHVQLHFTPTYSSWLNQMECWFSILSRAALRGASFASARQLRDAIDAFVETYGEKAVPFEWTKAMVESPHCTTERQHVASIEPTPVAFYPRDRQQSPEWCASALPA
jgi:transposase